MTNEFNLIKIAKHIKKSDEIKDVLDYYEPRLIRSALFILKQGTTFNKIKTEILYLRQYLFTLEHKCSFQIYKAFSNFERDKAKDLKLRNLVSRILDEVSEFLVERSGIIGG